MRPLDRTGLHLARRDPWKTGSDELLSLSVSGGVCRLEGHLW